MMTTLLPAPLPVVAREPLPAEPRANPPAVPAVVTPPAPVAGAGYLLALGVTLLVTAVFLLLVVLRRMRPTPQPSFITRSMERR